MGEQKEYDYLSRTADLLELVGSNQSNELSVESILKAKDIISEISDYVQKTQLFIETKDRYDIYVSSYKNIEDKQERIKDAWYNFVVKCVEAPTRIHLRAVVILCVPALNQIIDE